MYTDTENSRIDEAIELMDQFAEATGLVGEARPRRYLWTDAFAVCNWLGLYRTTGELRFRQLALRAIDQVHEVLGRHRCDDARRGWLSGLSDTAGRQHPTRGGLRIGKLLPERPAGEPLDEMLEWERDGQYFHYLTKWMHALHCAAVVCEDARFDTWGVELAIRAQQAFTLEVEPAGAGTHPDRKSASKRMVWKMSIGLDRPLVDSMGHHDPLDGLITCWELQSAVAKQPAVDPRLQTELSRATRDLQSLCRRTSWATNDALGAGGLLFDAVRLSTLFHQQQMGDQALLVQMWSDALESLQYLAPGLARKEPAEYRLAFRELGLSIGLRGLEYLPPAVASEGEQYLRTALERYRPLGESIEMFWRNTHHRNVSSWVDHGDINSVMLATSLAPAGLYTL